MSKSQLENLYTSMAKYVQRSAAKSQRHQGRSLESYFEWQADCEAEVMAELQDEEELTEE